MKFNQLTKELINKIPKNFDLETIDNTKATFFQYCHTAFAKNMILVTFLNRKFLHEHFIANFN